MAARPVRVGIRPLPSVSGVRERRSRFVDLHFRRRPRALVRDVGLQQAAARGAPRGAANLVDGVLGAPDRRLPCPSSRA